MTIMLYLTSHIWRQNVLNNSLHTFLGNRYGIGSLDNSFSVNACDALDFGGVMFDVSILTIEKKPAIEIVINNKTCVFKVTQKDLDSFNNEKAKELVQKCKSKKDFK